MFKLQTADEINRDWAEIRSSLLRETGLSGQGYLDWDVRTGQISWDPAWADLFGWPHGIGSGNAGLWEDAIHPHDLGEVMEKLNEHLRGLTSVFVARYRLNSHCGQPHSIDTSGLVMARNTIGRPTRVILTSHKIAALEYTMARRYESPLSRNT